MDDNKILTTREWHERSVLAAESPDIDSFVAAMEWALLYLGLPDKSIHYSADRTNKVSLSAFDGALLMENTGLDERMDSFQLLNPLSEKYESDFTLPLIGSMNVKTLLFGKNNETVTQLNRWRTLDAKETRHLRPKDRGRGVLEWSNAYLMDNDCWYTDRQGYAVQPTAPLAKSALQEILLRVSLDPQFEIDPKVALAHFVKDAEYSATLLRHYRIALSLAFSMRYEWFAYVREEKGLGFKIPIAPESIKNLNTTVQPGKTRRDAALHFVREHYRRVDAPYDPFFRETLVKEHFRGKTKFDYRGCEVHIIPAQDELERLNPKKKFLKK